MFQVPPEFFKNETVHRSIGNDSIHGVLDCGFLHKPSKGNSDRNLVFKHYGALLLLSGEGIHVDCDGREYKLYPGSLIQRIPGKRHSTFVHLDGKWLEFFICFGRGVFEALCSMGILDSAQDVLYPGLNMALFDTFKNFIQSLKVADQEELPLLLTEAQRIILRMYCMHKKNMVPDERAGIIKQACQLFNKDPRGRSSTRDISLQLGMGYESFRKVFKDEMGISPGDYRIQSRVNTAKTLLLDTDYSIKEIALVLGFPDSFTFSKQFKKVTGVSPSEFKQRA